MKRRVASLPPVSVAVFNQKVLERRQETAVALSPRLDLRDLQVGVTSFSELFGS